MDFRDRLARNRDGRRKNEDHQGMRIMLFVRYDEDDEKVWVWVPARYEVCWACEGRGKYVNPGIDSNGITGDEMRELGDDFREDYMSGTYDVTCDACDGRNVALVANEDAMSEELLKEWRDRQDEDAAYEAECEAERRAGC